MSFPRVAQVVRIERIVSELDGTNPRVEARFFVTSAPPERASAAQLLAAQRGHWAIENKVHYVRDRTWDEDRSQVRKGDTPHLMASLRNLALSVLRMAGAQTNIAAALRSCAWNTERVLRLLGV